MKFIWTEGRDYEVDSATGCWEWTGARSPQGYGYTYRAGRGVAHRVGYESLHGELSKAVHVHHRCENKACVNPEHLEALSHSEHSTRHGRASSDLTEQDIVTMRWAAWNGARIRDLADRYGITASTVGLICQGKKWRSAGGPIGVPQKRCAVCGSPIPACRNPRVRLYCTATCRDKASA